MRAKAVSRVRPNASAGTVLAYVSVIDASPVMPSRTCLVCPPDGSAVLVGFSSTR